MLPRETSSDGDLRAALLLGSVVHSGATSIQENKRGPHWERLNYDSVAIKALGDPMESSGTEKPSELS